MTRPVLPPPRASRPERRPEVSQPGPDELADDLVDAVELARGAAAGWLAEHGMHGSAPCDVREVVFGTGRAGRAGCVGRDMHALVGALPVEVLPGNRWRRSEAGRWHVIRPTGAPWGGDPVDLVAYDPQRPERMLLRAGEALFFGEWPDPSVAPCVLRPHVLAWDRANPFRRGTVVLDWGPMAMAHLRQVPRLLVDGMRLAEVVHERLRATLPRIDVTGDLEGGRAGP